MPELTVTHSPELIACTPEPVQLADFNPHAAIPCGVTIKHLCTAMNEWIEFMRIVQRK